MRATSSTTPYPPVEILNRIETASFALKPGSSRILVAVDGSDFSMKAADYALALAKHNSWEVFVVNVIDISSVFRMLPLGSKRQLVNIGRQQARQIFDDVADLAKKRGVDIKADTIESSTSAADALMRYARDKKIDLVVVGTKGRSGIKKALLGSIASKVVTHSPCPVLVVR